MGAVDEDAVRKRACNADPDGCRIAAFGGGKDRV